jgi:hypothetical protein
MLIENTLSDLITMTPEQWSKVPNNPRQRNTIERATTAKHLKNFIDEHAIVHAMRLADNTLVKLDGHTRCYLWENKLTDDIPSRLQVHVFRGKDMKDAALAYTHYDSSAAVETPRDKVNGAYRENNIVPKSYLLKHGRITGSLRFVEEIVTGRKNIYGQGAQAGKGDVIYILMPRYQPQIEALDAINPKHEFFPNAIITTMALTHLQFGDSAMKFWSLLNENSGTKINGFSDGVQILADEINDRQKSNKNLFTGRHNNEDIIGKALSAFDGFFEGKIFTRKPGGVNPNSWLRTISGKLKIHPSFRNRPEDDIEYVSDVETLDADKGILKFLSNVSK